MITPNQPQSHHQHQILLCWGYTSYTIYSTKTRYKHLKTSSPLNPQQPTLSKPVESVTPKATDHLNSQFQSKNHSQLRPKAEKLAFAKHQIVNTEKLRLEIILLELNEPLSNKNHILWLIHTHHICINHSAQLQFEQVP